MTGSIQEQLKQKNTQIELMREALNNLTRNIERLEDEATHTKIENQDLRRKNSSYSERQHVNSSKYKTQIASLESENAQLKKHINNLYSQLEQKTVFISKISSLPSPENERDTIQSEANEMRTELIQTRLFSSTSSKG